MNAYKVIVSEEIKFKGRRSEKGTKAKATQDNKGNAWLYAIAISIKTIFKKMFLEIQIIDVEVSFCIVIFYFH